LEHGKETVGKMTKQKQKVTWRCEQRMILFLENFWTLRPSGSISSGIFGFHARQKTAWVTASNFGAQKICAFASNETVNFQEIRHYIDINHHPKSTAGAKDNNHKIS